MQWRYYTTSICSMVLGETLSSKPCRLFHVEHSHALTSKPRFGVRGLGFSVRGSRFAVRGLGLGFVPSE